MTSKNRTTTALSIAAVAMAIFVLAASPANAQPIVLNGDFSSNAAAFTNPPGYAGDGINPAAIDNWATVGTTGAVGVNGVGISNPFGPADQSAATYYAFLQTSGMALTQTITLSANQDYDISFLAGARNCCGAGPDASGRVLVADNSNTYYDSTVTMWSKVAFQAVGSQFTTGASIDGQVVITLSNDSAAGDRTVTYSNVSITKLDLLTLEVNTVTGATTLLGHETEAIAINFYEITSPNNALDHENWLSLAAQDFDGNGPPSGLGDGWEESGGVGPHALAEGYLLGNSTIEAAASVPLGRGYNVDVGDTNLMFKYRTDSGRIFEGLVAYVDTPSVTGDFTGLDGVPDGVWDCFDINALVAEIVAGDDNPAFDMNGDGSVTSDDITDEDVGWLAVGGENNPDDTGGNPFLEGDANLDGAVDVSDFNEWNGSKFTSVAAWCSGDFNADGSVDVSDFNIWNGNKFTSSSGVAAVPEPSSMLLLAAGVAGLGMWRREGLAKVVSGQKN